VSAIRLHPNHQPRVDRFAAAALARMIEFAVRACAAETAQARITVDSTDPAPLWALAWRARAAGWMVRNRSLLERAVVA
jgi:hypothetical protein